MLAGKLRVELGKTSEGGILPEFRWWLVLLIGGIASDETNKSWAKRAFERIMPDSSVAYRRDDVKAVLRKFFWVEKIRGTKFNTLRTEALGIGDEVSEKVTLLEARPNDQAQQGVETRRCADYGTWFRSLK
jgi:hypothetical protein